MSLPPPRGRLRRSLAVVALVLLILSIYGLIRLGPFLAHEDTLVRADAIVVLAGSRIERPLEAADLYRDGWAPRVVVTDWVPEEALLRLRDRGIIWPSDTARAAEALQTLGVPADRVIVPPRLHTNTAQEAQTARALANANGWRRIIVVTSKFHLRRAGFAFRRELAGTGVSVVMHGSRYDPSNPARWWASRADLRWMLSEAPKLLAYVFGLGA